MGAGEIADGLLSQAIVWVVSTLLACCSLDAGDPCEGQPHIVGEVTQVDERNGQPAVLIEEDPAVDLDGDPREPGGDKTWFFIEGQTEILIRLDDGQTRSAGPEDLVPGQTGRGWTTGVILESYPGQTTASCIVVAEPPKG